MAFFRMAEFAAEEGVAVSVVKEWIEQGLPTTPGPRGMTLINEDEAADWLAENIDSDEDDERENPDDGEELENPDDNSEPDEDEDDEEEDDE